jgi:hypothetical protein
MANAKQRLIQQWLLPENVEWMTEEQDWRRSLHGTCGLNRMRLRRRMGTGQEQDCAWGNGMDMGTGMMTTLKNK